jgi:hypothetical protein
MISEWPRRNWTFGRKLNIVNTNRNNGIMELWDGGMIG